ncbi:MAG: sodium:proton antiporter [Chloroflexi bacterium CG07_land_8_20_14_0_80_45_17]|nr:MAG: sodium:proton antiporter [Chloroflexi bacterium CG23_combo_of_CG06-09_8_20_14_all_45_10]PIU56634.1 MAG: sodium:proton antiporter [Chloroflexi bacterium CG07_land_8_20_14_0_80_45_17]
MEMSPVLAIGIIITVGFFGGLLVRRFGLPMITGYIIVGILLSPSLLNVIPEATIGNLDFIINICLGIIAFMIGSSLRLESLRKVWRSIAWITLFQSLGAWFLITLLLPLLGHFILNIEGATFWQVYFPMAFVIGAVSCATAPAAIMAIVSEYRAKGPLTTSLLAVVTLDDAIAITAVAFALAISQSLVGGLGLSMFQMLGVPSAQIAGSVGLGLAFGFLLMHMTRLARTRELLLVIAFGMIMLCVGIADLLGISSILACMMAGFFLVNKGKRLEIFHVIEGIKDAIFVLLFVLAGLHFNLRIMQTTVVLAGLIVLLRCTGKYVGTRIGAEISHAPGAIKKYLGIALLPKAGVSVGLILLAEHAFPLFGAIMLNAVLASVIINELLAPPLVKYAIFKAREAVSA